MSTHSIQQNLIQNFGFFCLLHAFGCVPPEILFLNMTLICIIYIPQYTCSIFFIYCRFAENVQIGNEVLVINENEDGMAPAKVIDTQIEETIGRFHAVDHRTYGITR